MKNLKTVFLTLSVLLFSTLGFSQTDTTVQFSWEINVSQNSPYTQTYDTMQSFSGDSVLVYMKFSRVPNVNTGWFTVYKNGNTFLEFPANVLDNGDFDTTMVIDKNDEFEFTISTGNGNKVRVENVVYELLDNNGFPLSTENVEKVEMKLYPNPTTTNLNFEFGDYPNQVTYNVYNMSGQLVKQGELTNTLYVGDLTNGMYVINLNVDGQPTSKKFLKR